MTTAPSPSTSSSAPCASPSAELATDVCPAADRNGDGTVSIDELIAAVNVALAPCA